MNTMKYYLKILFSLILTVPALAQQSSFEILEQTSTELVIKYIPQQYDMKPVEVNQIIYNIPIGKNSGLTNETGKPALPVEATLIAVPPGKKIVYEILESKYITLENQKIAPVPAEFTDEEGETKIIYNKDENFYNTYTEYYPKDIIKIEQSVPLRYNIVAKLNFFPMSYIPATNTLRQCVHFVFRIRFLDYQSNKIFQLIEINDHQYESIYKSLILNYEQSKKFRYKEILSEKITNDSTRNWWETGRYYYKIPVVKDGMYRLTYQQMLNAGINLQTIPVSSIAIYYKGKAIPILVNTNNPDPQNWYIDFYGNRKYGDTTYFDIYSDTSIYWFTWNDSNPKRYLQQTEVLSSPNYFVKNHYLTMHFEKDSNYYYGYNDNEVRTVDDVKGEGWYWLDFYPNNVKTIQFTIDTLPPATGDTCRFRIRLHGTTAIDPPDTAVSRHLARIALNNNLIDSIFWIQNNEVIYSKVIKDSLLKQGTNTLEIRSVNIPTRVNKFYMDWFQLSYKSPLNAKNNYLDFTSPSFPTSDPVEFEISNITRDSIDIFDLTTNRLITNIYKVGNLWKFKDTCRIQKRYIITGKNQREIPSVIIPHLFQDIRSNPSGADYIIVTHPLFQTAANTLANDRSSRYNIRATVISVLDIYDEFNFGHINPVSIKTFLEYTYKNWQIPAPAYVTFFGDASIDFRNKFATTTKKNYVPGYGNPMSDNVFVCFDSIYKFIPYMIVGRLPVENQIQAQQVVNKILNYENPPKDYWNKRMMFITGGTTASERWQFNSLSDLLIDESVTSFPLGGEVFKVYKTSSAIIDGDYKYYMQGLVNEGLSFINFIGHSGGRIWNVDIGNPNDLQNTNGKLPFISSVSCNIGAFYSYYANVLSEDFLFADNKGAIGCWASSHISSANTGYWLAKKFLLAATKESVKAFGDLTHISKLYFWMINGYTTTPTIIYTFNLYPLIGEPLSKFAIPDKPNLVLNSDLISYSPNLPVADNLVYLKIILKNYGTMPADSITIWIKDNYTDEAGKNKGESDLIPPFKWRAFAYIDTINIEWDVRNKAGAHTITVIVDPLNSIDEINEADNSGQISLYIHKNSINVLQPLPFSIVNSGIQNLRVTVPMVFDTTQAFYTQPDDSVVFYKQQKLTTSQYSFYFELDTVSTFDSGFKISSPPVAPSFVYAEWSTPYLADGKVYFWRCRTYDGKHYGAWVYSSFNTKDSEYNGNLVQWNQQEPNQFFLNAQKNVEITQNGITMTYLNGMEIYVRSLGSRANMDQDYYSIIKIGNVVISGLWWYDANSYIIVRINPRNGEYIARGYTLSNVGQPDSMLSFIQNTPVGHYLVFAVVQNGLSGMNENLYQAIESLGAIRIRNVQPGHAWALISRKGTTGPMMIPLESYSPDAVADTDYIIPNYYRSGTGDVISPLIGPASSWQSFSWENQTPDKSEINVYIIGVKKDYSVDTLLSVPSNNNFVNLTSISPTIYRWLKLISRLSNQDGEVTPVLNKWKLTYTRPPELATSPLVFNAPKTVKRSEPLNVNLEIFNLDDKVMDSVNVSFSIFPDHLIESMWIDSISANSSKMVTRVLDVSNFVGEQILLTTIESDSNFNELVLDNNKLYYNFSIDFDVSVLEEIEIRFDGKSISNGDYVSAKPKLQIILPKNFPIDELQAVNIGENNLLQHNSKKIYTDPTIIEFTPELATGEHKLTIFGKNNKVLYSISFKVSSEPMILDVFAYPNPFSNETFFTFNLVGETKPEEVVIDIYTTAGRKIKELKYHNLEIGFQRIKWDGRDKDGTEIANGVYLYRIRAKYDREITSKFDKIVRFR